MENIVNMPRPEILMVADTVAREKNIDREDVFKAMEEAIQKAGRSKYGFEHDIRVNINRKTGAITLARYRAVVDVIENETTELTLAEAQRINPDIKVGEYIIDPLPPIDFGRIAAQTAKQVIMQKVREAERNKQYEEYKEKIGTRLFCAVMKSFPGKISKTATAFVLMCWMSVAKLADRRFSFLALVRNLWPSCLRPKCRKFMTVW